MTPEGKPLHDVFARKKPLLSLSVSLLRQEQKCTLLQANSRHQAFLAGIFERGGSSDQPLIVLNDNFAHCFSAIEISMCVTGLLQGELPWINFWFQVASFCDLGELS